MTTLAPAPTVDLAGILWNSLLQLPGQWATAVAANPGPWILIATIFVCAVAMKLIPSPRRHRARRRS